jgi:hypothetical protein
MALVLITREIISIIVISINVRLKPVGLAKLGALYILANLRLKKIDAVVDLLVMIPLSTIFVIYIPVLINLAMTILIVRI